MEQIGNYAIGKRNARQAIDRLSSMTGYKDKLSSMTDYRQANMTGYRHRL